jgi:hypothetical protein
MAGAGKESDTAAALAGAVIGAQHGEEGIPEDWRHGLLGGGLVTAFADALAGTSATAPPDLVEAESELTGREERAREPLVAEHARRRAREERRTAAHPKRPQPVPTPEPLPFPPPPETYLRRADDPDAKRRERAARGRKRIEWKAERRRAPRRGE